LNNDQLSEHNNAIKNHQPFDVILTCVDQQGQAYHSHTVGLPQFDNHGKFTGYIGCGHDISESYTLKQQFEYQATHDELTGLWNRRAFGAYLKKLHEHAQQAQPAEQSLLCIDLDKFKLVNDSAGHQAGDQLLRVLSDLFERVFGKHAVLARLGGDEFGAVLPCGVDEAMRLSHGLIEKIGRHQFHWKKRKYSVGACIGVVAIDQTSRNSSDLLSKADIACYSAKESGRNQAQKYTTQSTFQIQQADELNKVQLLNNAISDGNVTLYLQPIVPTGNTVDDRVKYEVLLRIRDENGEFLSSSDIIPVAEKYERMQHLDLWVTERTLAALEDLADLNVSGSLSVNLSGNTLSCASTLTQIVELVSSHRIEPGSLCFEITETAAIANIDKVLVTMRELRALGCEFSLDDFGSGLSSFGYLKSLPVEYLKIDGSFVRNITEDRACRAIVTAFNTLSHEMGIKTVAEFVENKDIAELLTDLKIDYLQGYSVGMPRDIDDWLDDYRAENHLTGT
ncbi:MAG: EAL domain-containing protein, partial [Pseudomonadota bacterium]